MARRVLALGLAATGVLLAAVLGAFESTPVVLVGSAVAGWCFVAALLGFARERVTRSSPQLRYLAETAFPIYVLHQPVVVVLAAGVVLLPLGIAAKFVLLLAGSVAVTLGVYHYGVRPFGPTRFLIGMKPLRRGSRSQPASAAALSPPKPSGASYQIPLLVLLAVLLLPGLARASDPTGLWWAEGGFAQVEIRRCGGDALCGEVVWLRHPFDEHGCELRDLENPDDAREPSVLRVPPAFGPGSGEAASGDWARDVADRRGSRRRSAILVRDRPRGAGYRVQRSRGSRFATVRSPHPS